jgi:hypothetical protein
MYAMLIDSIIRAKPGKEVAGALGKMITPQQIIEEVKA